MRQRRRSPARAFAMDVPSRVKWRWHRRERLTQRRAPWKPATLTRRTGSRSALQYAGGVYCVPARRNGPLGEGGLGERRQARVKDPMNVIDTRLPELLRGSRPLLGMFVGIPSPALVEICGHAGLDFVIIDNEHGPAGIESTENMLRAARGAGIIPVVRTLEADILRVLDIGASAIQVPQVNTAEQARRIVAAAKYPPVGTRGAAFSTRAAGYGFFGGDVHIKAANEGTSVIVMAETRTAIENIDEIVAVRVSAMTM